MKAKKFVNKNIELFNFFLFKRHSIDEFQSTFRFFETTEGQTFSWALLETCKIVHDELKSSNKVLEFVTNPVFEYISNSLSSNQ